MALRPFAEAQPESFAFTAESQGEVDRTLAKYPPGRQASAVVPLLWQAQKQNGNWLPRKAIEEVARLLDMPDIRVLEIATFYSMFNLEPVGRYFVQMCGTTPCVLRGSDDIKAVLQARIGEQRQVTADGMFSWLEVECLGACCNAPMAQINDAYYEDLSPENLGRRLDALAAGRPVRTGSQTGRATSEPAGGLTSLASLYGLPDKVPPHEGVSVPAASGVETGRDGAHAEAQDPKMAGHDDLQPGRPPRSDYADGSRTLSTPSQKSDSHAGGQAAVEGGVGHGAGGEPRNTGGGDRSL